MGRRRAGGLRDGGVGDGDVDGLGVDGSDEFVHAVEAGEEVGLAAQGRGFQKAVRQG